MTKPRANNEVPTTEKNDVKAVESPPAQLSEADLDNIMEHLSDEALDAVAGGAEAY
ncbi:MAG: hypothetical protein WCH32_18260 [Pseudomonadota bacterium]